MSGSALTALAFAAVVVLGFAAPPPTPSYTPNIDPGPRRETQLPVPLEAPSPQPVIPPAEAFQRGWMPLSSTGVDRFLRTHPTADGRGVLIGILDGGLDAGIPGLQSTSTGDRKILDLRDFSDEGAISLTRVAPRGDSVVIAGHPLYGFGRVGALNAKGPYFAGSILELSLGPPPAADLNGNGRADDTLNVVVTRASDGWVLFTDSDGDGSLANERGVHDYLSGRETFGWTAGGRPTPLTVAVNFLDEGGERGPPRLHLFFDTDGHGSHVAGIAAGNGLYGIKGFDGVAPGAQLLGLKIANDALGGLSVTGSIARAMDYAIRFAAARRSPLVLNLSYGVGNEREGSARIDRLVDSILRAHPDVVFTVAAGNDGPGLSTVGFPASATRAVTVGATFPEAVLVPPGDRGGVDPIAYFSARGGELAKPELVAPGGAYSTVPRWHRGNEKKFGTSMAAPYAAGLSALLLSGGPVASRPEAGRLIKQALMVTARPLAGGTFVDQGTGLPDVGAAFRWLVGAHLVPEVQVQAADHGSTAAFRPTGLSSPADTLQEFLLRRAPGAPSASYRLRSDARWLATPATVTLNGAVSSVTLTYHGGDLSRPGSYTGTVSGWSGDTMAGPIFRLVNTVVVPWPAESLIEVASSDPIVAGGQHRLFFRADSGRPFLVEIGSPVRNRYALASLHEPGGQPFRGGERVTAGFGDLAAGFQVDGRDVVPGYYEADAAAFVPGRSIEAWLRVTRSPVTLDAKRKADGVAVTLRNLTAAPVSATAALGLVGGERNVTVIAQGSDAQPVSFGIPAWAVHATVDVTLDPADWGRFTDFGVGVFDAAGRQLGRLRQDYGFGRLHLDFPEPHGVIPANLVFFPGFADTASAGRWVAMLSIRLYPDSNKAVSLGSAVLDLSPGVAATTTLKMAESSGPLGDAFYPLGVLAVRIADRVWTREVGLPAPTPPLAP
ncbi:MAG: S8 family serine peptidase [Gemmatimonadales bacterium]